MPTKRIPGSRPGLIHCDNCGEEYSASYKRCPFCDDYQDDYADDSETAAAAGGGKRLAASNKRGGGYGRTSPLKVIGIILSLAIIAAAVWIVVTKLLPAIHRGNLDGTDPNDAAVSATLPASESASPDGDPAAVSSNSGTTDPENSSEGTEPVDGVGAVGFTLDKTDVTLEPDEVWSPVVTFTPEGSTGQLTWTSEKPNIAAVSAIGEITNVNTGSSQISVTVTATLPNGTSHSCIVRCKGGSTDPNAPSAEPSAEPSVAPSTPPSTPTSNGSTTYKTNNPDFTFYHVGEQFRYLRVVGYSGTVTWTSSDPSVVSVDSNGLCTAVGTGRRSCTITGTLENGTQVTAIARIDI